MSNLFSSDVEMHKKRTSTRLSCFSAAVQRLGCWHFCDRFFIWNLRFIDDGVLFFRGLECEGVKELQFACCWFCGVVSRIADGSSGCNGSGVFSMAAEADIGVLVSGISAIPEFLLFNSVLRRSLAGVNNLTLIGVYTYHCHFPFPIHIPCQRPYCSFDLG